MKHNGYTLIELLAVTSILVILGGLIVSILYSTLRGSNKTNVTNAVAQNGNYALSVISTIIYSSENVISCTGSSVSTLQFVQVDGGITTLVCDDGNNTVSSNSASLIDTSKVKITPSSCYFKCTQPSNDPYSTPLIDFGFVLEDINSGAFFESSSSGVFKTSASMRNYKPR